jgi:hypothetical protein
VALNLSVACGARRLAPRRYTVLIIHSPAKVVDVPDAGLQACPEPVCEAL